MSAKSEPQASGEPLVIPAGLVAVPELGPEVVGARLRPVVVRWRWVVAGILVILAIAVLIAIVPRFTSSPGDVAMLLALVVLLAGVTSYRLVLAWHGPAISVSLDADHLIVSMPFNHARVPLAAITKITLLRSDVLVEAKGAIERNGRLTGARWLPLEGIKSLEVDRDAFVAYLRHRIAEAGGRPAAA
ncbi:MAG: hypothetical protein LWW77_09785 [Propionibacteriales bacterium]|nr:hypothetical protein [Propionibacteriales bacterium]